MSDLKRDTASTDYFKFLFVSISVVAIYQYFFVDIPVPTADALTYIQYGINLSDHGIFGKDVNPDYVIMPLFPFLIYLTSLLDEKLYQSLSCLLNDPENTSCILNLDFFVWIQCIFVIITLSSIWLLAKLLTKSNFIAWCSSAFAFLSGELVYYAVRFLTETLIISLFSAFVLTLYLSFRTKKLHWHAVTALLLALLTLTRPEYHYLFYIIFISQFLFCLFRNNKFLWQSLLLVFISYYAIVGPWQARNYYHFGNPALTDNYGSFILTYRVAYNQMSWTEWGVAFIYWFPDCGDSISKKLFPKDYYQKLTFDKESYYLKGTQKLMKKIRKETDSPDQVLDYLLKNEIFGNLFKHSMVTLPLAWRGIFIAKYWGVLGLLCFTILAFRFRDPVNQQLLYLSLPAWFLVFLHAFVSVSIPRYNLFLILFYSISTAIIFCSTLNFFSKNMKQKKQNIN